MTSARAALLIADIGGYTAYMSSHRMTLAHAEVNTARMLDRMIGAAPGFDLVEIEGDAAFLSRKVDASGLPLPTKKTGRSRFLTTINCILKYCCKRIRISLFWSNAYLTANYLAVLENEDSRDVAYSVFGGKFLVGIYIDFPYYGFPFKFFTNLVDDRTYHAAGSTPRCPKVNHYGLI